MVVGMYFTMNERMRGGNTAEIYKLRYRQPLSQNRSLPPQSLPPILLSLPGVPHKPSPLLFFGQEATDDRLLVGEKVAPKSRRTDGVNGVAVGTTPALQRDPLRNNVEVAIHISVPPKPVTFAGGTTARPRPLKGFSVRQDFTTIDRQIQCQGCDPWYWI